MNNFEDIQQLWQQSSPGTMIQPGEIVRQITQQQRRESTKMIGSTATLLFTFLFIMFVSFYYHFSYLSTRLGIVLILLCIAAAVFINSRMIALLYRNNIKPDTDNKTMLANMEKYQRRQHFFQTTFMSAYYLLLTVGLLLYMYELTRSNYLFMLIAYALSLGWIAFAWWYIRPRTIRKQTARVNEIISHIKSLQNELTETEVKKK